ncbi:MAG TPA: cation:proton antiporter [Candidatus Avimuribaculum pullicola]|nr:cation:proton antiporter [Candidatus Avimuribaculum pullicola]
MTSIGAEQSKELHTEVADNSGEQDTSFQTNSLIGDLALILVVGAVAAIIFKKLKQPVVLGYIVAGFLVGPHFNFFPTIANEANIDFWAQIGIVILLFSLGLEFSFKKLLNVGGSAVVTALIIVTCMMGIGLIVGHLLGFTFIDALFLGAMLSMSSTTIIIKAFTDLNMRQRKFTAHVFAVLVCEDLFAVVMMVILSSIAINKSVAGEEMLMSILKLVFFLVITFTVGVFVIPTFFNYFRKFINEELLLVTAMGLCMLASIFSVASGFSLALGAFLMGAILAGTCEAEHIEKVVTPVKDLFGAVFFISVGMMVDPVIISEYAGIILLLSVVVIVGMILFGTIGSLVAGQDLKASMETGFSLTQIGEFAFIIASLGMSLGVLNSYIYPIVVAVSVLTTFGTPYFIKMAEPAYNFVSRHLPERLQFLIVRYSTTETQLDEGQTLWRNIIKRSLWRILLYTVISIAIILLSELYLMPWLENLMGKQWGDFIAVVATLVVLAPFLIALAVTGVKRSEREKLNQQGNNTKLPLVLIFIIRLLAASVLLIGYLGHIYSPWVAIILGSIVFIVIVLFFSNKVKRNLHDLEEQFMKNLNERELRRSGRDAVLVSDLHMAQVTVGHGCPFVGERLRNADIRRQYGVNVVNIQRGEKSYPIPTADMRIFPGDILGIVGTDSQIQALLPIVEKGETIQSNNDDREINFVHFEIGDNSPLIGQTTATARLRDDYSALLVAIQRGTEYLKPDGAIQFCAHDVLWIVGDTRKLEQLK